ncbi:MAG: WecB/TagA/CpsF family glycosyltransferase [Anaerolineae bacterium]|nr:WecB/TagA/CpsF family glycosyltransferase [Anaerolineae bacterium]MEB2366843.1 WecB/TagA/CpsF family glycosyltransferase [Chloroflexota bacterium]
MTRILCVQWANIGDLILTTPALAALRDAHPDAHIGLLTTPGAAPVVGGLGLVDTVYTLPRFGIANAAAMRVLRTIRAGRYDTIVFFHRLTTRAGAWKYAALAAVSGATRRIGLDNGRGRFLTDRVPDHGFGAPHQAASWLALVERLGADPTPRPCRVAEEPYPLPEASAWIAVHAGSGDFSMARRWPADLLAQAVDTLADDLSAQIVVVGADGDDSPDLIARLKHPALDLTGKTSVPRLAGVLRQCALYVGSDSGVTHVAAAVGTPTVAVFGPTNDAAYGPWSPEGKAAVVRTMPRCAPCSYVDHELGAREGCPARTCLHMVRPSDVAAAARRLLVGEPQPALKPLPPRPAVEAVRILGLPVHAVTFDQWLDIIGAWVRAGDGLHHVCTINPEFVMVAQTDPVFRRVLRQADLCVPDGIGLLLAARMLGRKLPERVTGSDGVPRIAERAAREGWSLFLLGAAEGIAAQAAAILIERYPGLKIAGTFSGSARREDEDAQVAMINASGADILLVAYGAPKQDAWIARNAPRLNVKMAMGIGGSLDFVAGIVPRAPVWMQRAGIEWLFRLIRQPWRIKRMLRLPRFVWAVLRRRGRGAWEPA